MKKAMDADEIKDVLKANGGDDISSTSESRVSSKDRARERAAGTE